MWIDIANGAIAAALTNRIVLSGFIVASRHYLVEIFPVDRVSEYALEDYVGVWCWLPIHELVKHLLDRVFNAFRCRAVALLCLIHLVNKQLQQRCANLTYIYKAIIFLDALQLIIESGTNCYINSLSHYILFFTAGNQKPNKPIFHNILYNIVLYSAIYCYL